MQREGGDAVPTNRVRMAKQLGGKVNPRDEERASPYARTLPSASSRIGRIAIVHLALIGTSVWHAMANTMRQVALVRHAQQSPLKLPFARREVGGTKQTDSNSFVSMHTQSYQLSSSIVGVVYVALWTGSV